MTQLTHSRPLPDRQAIVREAHAARARFLAEMLDAAGAGIRRGLNRLASLATRRQPGFPAGTRAA
jgi:hypothetical protein